jgi:hypothetical protein
MQKNLNNFQTRFSSSVICGVMFCFFLILSVITLACGQTGNAAILPLIGFIFSIPLYWQVRFDSDGATLFCFIVPRKVLYHEVKEMRFFFSNPSVPEAPANIFFELKDGRKVRWELTLFSPETRKQIKEALEIRLNLAPAAETTPVRVENQEWIQKASKVPKAEKIICGIGSLLFLLLFTFELTTQLNWNNRLRTWEQVDGVILKHERKRVKSGKSTKTVSILEYRYSYKNKVYTGNKIVFGNNTYPLHVKRGAIRKILVDPANPAESAAMFTYRGIPGVFLRYFKTGFFGIIALITGMICYAMVFKKPYSAPEKLLRYLADNPAPVSGNKRKKKKIVSSVITLSGVPRQYDERYLLLPGGVSKTVKILTLLPLLLLLPAIIFGTAAVWILAAIWGFIAFSLWLPQTLVFDMQEKKFFRCRTFKGEKVKKAKSTSFDNWESLALDRVSAGRQGVQIRLTANSKDGNSIVICLVPLSRLPLLLDMLPDFAGKLGKLPIIFQEV